MREGVVIGVRGSAIDEVRHAGAVAEEESGLRRDVVETLERRAAFINGQAVIRGFLVTFPPIVACQRDPGLGRDGDLDRAAQVQLVPRRPGPRRALGFTGGWVLGVIERDVALELKHSPRLNPNVRLDQEILVVLGHPVIELEDFAFRIKVGLVPPAPKGRRRPREGVNFWMKSSARPFLSLKMLSSYVSS